MIYLFNLLGINPNGLLYGLFKELSSTDPGKAFLPFILGLLICIIVPYLLGSLNFGIIISKYLYNDDIRNYGSGNAGLTNMHRVYGKKGALYTLGGDMLKQFLSVVLGMLVYGEGGAYLAGTFCMLGHIAPIYYHFKGGKGVLTAATMVLLIDPLIFVCLFAIFVLIVLIFKYISLGSVMAGFLYPAFIYLRAVYIYHATAPLPAMLFSFFTGLLLIFMHRENMRRIFNNEENRFSFKKKPVAVDAVDENPARTEFEEIEEEHNKKKKKK
ncbi:MAG: acyl-phosphate glycerol 3-phosphate acyltransferase [Clostridiales bacterium GWF2_36_10]|nr:MAG: acyl-phosphate glycerol 3-phosphate acyltransferase [Clostridiales bacterium GWF2_36_10]HAN20668.1 acyl-phosphate glycerol 3-phosphate acyltransferase [Clostridiales bacterium]